MVLSLYLSLALLSYFFDRLFGEFSFLSFYKHPVVFMGEYIKWFESRYYKDSILRGFFLTISLVGIVYGIVYIIQSHIDNIYFLALLGSTTISNNMLKKSVEDIVLSPSNIKYLVSRDTENLSTNDINKAAVETYAENLSDGVVAPLFYMLLFGLVGAFVYKAINTLDSMVGYRNSRYEHFGKVSARLDDIVNYIPSKITAILISLYFFDFKGLRKLWFYGKLHDSPNAGYPIAAMALALGVKLGGPTSYFGKIKDKPYFGFGRAKINRSDILKATRVAYIFDIFFVSLAFYFLVFQ